MKSTVGIHASLFVGKDDEDRAKENCTIEEVPGKEHTTTLVRAITAHGARLSQ
ncbi:MAG: hypothetical protein MR440_00665 [Firmicutes bacterium]|nr:hypothetical protein [Bacillota bacterium]